MSSRHARSETINPRPSVLKLGALAKQEVDIALSSIRESLLDLHASQALELIEHARDQVSTRRALEIYCHLHRVGGHEALMLRTRVLARLGDRTAKRGTRASHADAQAAEEGDSPWYWIRRIRKRLQGRKNLELRVWVELHSGRTQTKLLNLHVGGALRLVELLKPETSYAEVVQLYADSMGVPASLSRAIYFLVLSQLSENKPAAVAPALVEPPKPSEQRREEQPLRIAKR
jgi:hypothetical protein